MMMINIIVFGTKWSPPAHAPYALYGELLYTLCQAALTGSTACLIIPRVGIICMGCIAGLGWHFQQFHYPPIPVQVAILQIGNMMICNIANWQYSLVCSIAILHYCKFDSCVNKDGLCFWQDRASI